uniref:cytochrome c biogenesis protein transmembrane region n=1 Tax=Pulvinaster venetus TaxID=427767 RepID=UPI001FCD83BB|nr:cytochrome c biogenesis protein transmembrane region [Pulvinaster venetus]UNJ16948.1 cytochrome c biogenesis protein transmembrane region [Pulvinaster venetus]
MPFFEIYFYNYKQYINHILNLNILEYNNLNFFIIFLFGIIGSLSPCNLSMIPIYISYITKSKVKKNNYFNNILYFSIGNFISCFALGIISTFLNKLYNDLIINIVMFTDFIKIVISLSLLNIVKFRLIFDNKIIKKQYKNNLFEIILLGVTTGASASACNAPLISIIMLWTIHYQNLFFSLVIFFIYTLATITPILLSTTFTGLFQHNTYLKNISSYLIFITGTILLSHSILNILLLI